MATPSEVKAGLDDIAKTIRSSINMRAQAKAGLLAARNQLASVPTTFADVLAEINGYTPTGARETLTKSEKADLSAEFAALKSALETELTALGVTF